MKNKPEDKEADGTLFALELTEAVDFDILSEHGLPAIEFLMYSHRETGEHVFTVHQGGLTEEQMRMIRKEMGVE